MNWIALFSNSGNEIAEVSKRLGRYPDRIICDKKRTEWNTTISEKVELLSHDEICDTLSVRAPLNSLVTLHGYLRILPPRAILPFTYNVHPGDIVKYPELKGIHPQKKALELDLPATGVVIHEVVPEVDSGEIVGYMPYVMRDNETEATLIDSLRDISIQLWVDLLESRYYGNKT